jgi:glycosyltransferase involved in cell wall biosynthesis
MKIGIDISQIVYGTGVSRYTQELVTNLIKIDRENEYVFFFSSLRQKISNFLPRGKAGEFQTSNKNVKFKIFKLPPTILDLLWNRIHIINIENFIGRINIFHSSDWIQPPAQAIKITTVHDLSFLHYPQAFTKKIIQVHTRRLKWVKEECDMVLADSKATKKDLIELLNFDEKKIRVVYLGVDEKFKIESQLTVIIY